MNVMKTLLPIVIILHLIHLSPVKASSESFSPKIDPQSTTDPTFWQFSSEGIAGLLGGAVGGIGLGGLTLLIVGLMDVDPNSRVGLSLYAPLIASLPGITFGTSGGTYLMANAFNSSGDYLKTSIGAGMGLLTSIGIILLSGLLPHKANDFKDLLIYGSLILPALGSSIAYHFEGGSSLFFTIHYDKQSLVPSIKLTF